MANNDLAGPFHYPSNANQVGLKTTDNGGVHTPHVIVDSGAGTTTVTQVPANMGASASVSIPAGAVGWTFTVLTGTGSVGAATGLPAGFSDSDPNILAAPLVVQTASASTAYVRYGTAT